MTKTSRANRAKFLKKSTFHRLTGWNILSNSSHVETKEICDYAWHKNILFHAILTTKRGSAFNFQDIIAIQIEILIRKISIRYFFLKSFRLNVSVTCNTGEKWREAGTCSTTRVFSPESTFTTSRLKLPLRFILFKFSSIYLLKADTPVWIRTTSIQALRYHRETIHRCSKPIGELELKRASVKIHEIVLQRCWHTRASKISISCRVHLRSCASNREGCPSGLVLGQHQGLPE